MLDPEWRKKDFSAYDIVYHVAGIAHADVGNVSEEVKQKYYAVNTDLSIEVARKAKEEGVKEFIFMSSMIVYGDSAPYGKRKIIDKNTVPHPANFYGDSKLQADVGVRELAGTNFKVIVLRPPMIYGKGSKGNYPILAKLAKKLPIFPEVTNERSMLHIDNLCEFLCQIMLIKEITNESVVLIPQNVEWTKTSDMVHEINQTEVMEVDRLSDKVQFYDREAAVIENAEKRDARLAAQKQEVTTGKKSIHSRLGEKKQKTSERKSDGKSVNKEQVTL